MIVDLNCDLGEGSAGDSELIPLVTSVNVACGGHAGDPETMLRTLEQAMAHGVRVGAHPGHFDREHFGRVEIPRSSRQVFADVLAQVGALVGIAKGVGIAVTHLKPHGALYHQAYRDDSYAEPIVQVCERLGLSLVGLPGSRLQALASRRCAFISEGFADRGYRHDGSLIPRTEPGAFLDDADIAVAQVERLLRESTVRTICVHGDNPHAIAFVRRLVEALTDRGIPIRAFA